MRYIYLNNNSFMKLFCCVFNSNRSCWFLFLTCCILIINNGLINIYLATGTFIWMVLFALAAAIQHSYK